MTASQFDGVMRALHREGVGFVPCIQLSRRTISWRSGAQKFELYFSAGGALESAAIASPRTEVDAFKVDYMDGKESYQWLFRGGSCYRFYRLAEWLEIDLFREKGALRGN